MYGQLERRKGGKKSNNSGRDYDLLDFYGLSLCALMMLVLFWDALLRGTT
jgi:hypothetical protein